MIGHDRIQHGWAWLKGPVAGLFGTGFLVWLAALPWAGIMAAVGAAVPGAIGTYWGWRDRRVKHQAERAREEERHKEWLLYHEARRKRLHATPADQIDPAQFRPEHEEPPR